MGDNDDLIQKKYRWYGGGASGLANDSLSAKLAAAEAAGSPIYNKQSNLSLARAYQTVGGRLTPYSTIPLPLGSSPSGIQSTTIDQATGQTKTSYQGLPAYRNITNWSNLQVAAGYDLGTAALDVQEDGVLSSFLVAVNDPDFKITCQLYGDTGTVNTLVNDTVEEVTFTGRGLTHQQALATAQSGAFIYSLDLPGTKDDEWPWIQRYRSTPSLNALQNNLTYAQYSGTKDDIWIVLTYTPAVKEGYSRIYFNVTNKSSNSRLILKLQMSRIIFQNSMQPEFHSATGDYAVAGEPVFHDSLV